jgi:hypothetical protein
LAHEPVDTRLLPSFVISKSPSDRSGTFERMFARVRGALQMVLGLALLALLVTVLAWFVYTSITEAPAVVAAVVTAVGAVLAVVAERIWAARREEERARRERMAPIYDELITGFYRSVRGTRASERKLERSFEKLALQLVIWGDPRVIGAFNEFRSDVVEDEDAALPNLLALERFIRAMRIDLGHDDKDLAAGDLLRIFVNDLDEHLAAAMPSEQHQLYGPAADPHGQSRAA